MFEVIYSETEYGFLDQASCDEIEILRKEFSVFNIQDIQSERPLLVKENRLEFFTFTGTKINRTLRLYFELAEIKYSFDENSSSFEIEHSSQNFMNNWNKQLDLIQTIDVFIEKRINSNPAIFGNSKWGLHLPPKYQINLVKQTYFELASVQEILKNRKLIQNK